MQFALFVKCVKHYDIISKKLEVGKMKVINVMELTQYILNKNASSAISTREIKRQIKCVFDKDIKINKIRYVLNKLLKKNFIERKNIQKHFNWWKKV